jgi:hypothetical protein
MSTYPTLEVGDDSRVPVNHKGKQGYKDSFSLEMHTVEDKNSDYILDGSLHPRKDIRLVKGNVINAPTKNKAQQYKSKY